MFKNVADSLWALAIGLVVAYGLVCLYALVLGDRFLFASEPPTYRFSPETIVVPSRLGSSIALSYLPLDGAKYVILYSHGNREDIGFIRPRMELFRKHGFAVLSYDYPGFGISTGEKTEDGCFAAADAAYKYLTETLKIPSNRIILYGRSMGGGCTAYLASKHAVAGVVMHSTFVSAFRVQTGIRLLPWDRFDNLERIRHVRSPLLFIHGLSDETIPAWHTEMMLKVAQEKARVPTMSLLVPLALHNNVIEIARDDYWDVMDRFLELIRSHTATQVLPATQPLSHSPQ